MEHSNHTILLVEDDPDDVQIIKEALSDSETSLNIIHKKDGLEAWHYLKQLQNEKQPLPCLIITDINMPLFDGKKLVSSLKNDPTFYSIPVIVFTTSSSKLDKEFFKCHDVPMITKPGSLKEFNAAVISFLDNCIKTPDA